jgi:hypothetical protein
MADRADHMGTAAPPPPPHSFTHLLTYTHAPIYTHAPRAKSGVLSLLRRSGRTPPWAMRSEQRARACLAQ